MIVAVRRLHLKRLSMEIVHGEQSCCFCCCCRCCRANAATLNIASTWTGRRRADGRFALSIAAAGGETTGLSDSRIALGHLADSVCRRAVAGGADSV